MLPTVHFTQHSHWSCFSVEKSLTQFRVLSVSGIVTFLSCPVRKAQRDMLSQKGEAQQTHASH